MACNPLKVIGHNPIVSFLHPEAKSYLTRFLVRASSRGPELKKLSTEYQEMHLHIAFRVVVVKKDTFLPRWGPVALKSSYRKILEESGEGIRILNFYTETRCTSSRRSCCTIKKL